MKKNFLKIFIFIMIIFLTPKVFAQEFNMNAYTSATKTGTKNRYRATEIYNYGTSGTYTFGIQYSGRISDIETYFDYPFSANMTYTLTYNMNTDDFINNFGSSYWWYCDQEMTNNNAHVVLPTYLNYRKVKLTFTTGNDPATCIRVWLRSTNINSTPITSITNWRLNSITIYDPEWQDGTTSSGGSQGTTSGSQGTTPNNSNQDIINNANQNSQDIINNANENTNSIIENNNTSSIDSVRNNFDTINNNCGMLYKYSTFKGKAFNTDGSFYDNSAFYFTDDYVELLGASNLVLEGFSSNGSGNLIVYDSNMNVLGYWGVSNRTITLPSNAIYFRFSTTIPSGRIFKDKGCTSKIEEASRSQIESQKVCNDIDKNNIEVKDYYLTGTASVQPSSGFGITSFIPINQSASLKVLSIRSGTGSLCFYNSNKSYISCISNSNMSVNEELTIPSGTSYFRATINVSSNKPTYSLCKNGNQALTDSLNSDNIDSGLGSDFFSDFQDNNHGLTAIITAPLNAINSIATSSCQALSVPIPFTNRTVSLPCMSEIYEQNIPTVYNIWKVVSFGIIAYFICVDIFHIVKGFKDPESDKVEVLDL